MSFSRKRELPVLRRRCKRRKKRISKAQTTKYFLHWAYPTAFIAAVVVIVSLYLCQCAQLVCVQYRSIQFKEQRNILLGEQKRVKLSIEKLESLERIEQIAMEDLKMVYPERRLILNLKRPTSTALAVDDLNTASP